MEGTVCRLDDYLFASITALRKVILHSQDYAGQKYSTDGPVST